MIFSESTTEFISFAVTYSFLGFPALKIAPVRKIFRKAPSKVDNNQGGGDDDKVMT